MYLPHDYNFEKNLFLQKLLQLKICSCLCHMTLGYKYVFLLFFSDPFL
jgi:hypothetical protein